MLPCARLWPQPTRGRRAQSTHRSFCSGERMRQSHCCRAGQIQVAAKRNADRGCAEYIPLLLVGRAHENGKTRSPGGERFFPFPGPDLTCDNGSPLLQPLSRSPVAVRLFTRPPSAQWQDAPVRLCQASLPSHNTKFPVETYPPWGLRSLTLLSRATTRTTRTVGVPRWAATSPLPTRRIIYDSSHTTPGENWWSPQHS